MQQAGRRKLDGKWRRNFLIFMSFANNVIEREKKQQKEFTFCNGNLISSNVKMKHLHSFHVETRICNGVIVEGISVKSNC